MGNNIRKRPEGALLRTYLSAAGVSPGSIGKPLVGVATAATQVFSEKPDARDLGGAAVSGIEAAGGIAVRWDTVRSPELMAWGHADGYSFAWRDQLADLIESWASQEALDGLVLVGDAPETLIGMSMAAARLNIPAVVVTVGTNRWEFDQEKNGETRSKKGMADPYELITEALFSKKKGKKDDPATTPSENGQEQFNKCLLTQDNYSFNAIDLVLEALGACLPGMSTAPARSPRLHELAYQSGERIINLIKTSFGFRRILSANAFTNAIRLNSALGGSVDVAVHLMALANEAGLLLSMDMFDKIAKETAQICNLGGVNDKAPHRLEELDKAGGVWAILHALKSSVMPTNTVSGKGAMELAKSTQVKDTHIINSHRPYKKQSGVGILRGNLAPHGAVFLLNQVSSGPKEFRGPVAIFEDEFEAAKAIHENKVKKGTAVVIRSQGPKGGPGLHKLRIVPALLESRGLNATIPLITDGRLPDTPAGLFISFVSPESGVKGPLAVLKDGDLIDIDIEKRQLGVRLTETDIQIRYARWQAPESSSKRGFLARYSKSVSGVHEGAVLK